MKTQTFWETNIRDDAQRVIHNAHYIATGFFRLNGFTVLPFGTSFSQATNVVIMPDVPLATIPRFWEKVARLEVDKIENSDSWIFLPEIEKLLIENKSPRINIANIQKSWQVVQDEFLTEVYDLLPHKKDIITKLVVKVSPYGTNCSFTFRMDQTGIINVWLRADQGVGAIAEAILTSLTRVDVYDKLNGTWHESEMIVDWLISQTKLAKLLTDHPLTIRTTRSKQHGNILEKSTRFLHKIGAPFIDSETFKTLDLSKFNDREKKLWQAFVDRSGQLLTVQEIGDLLFEKNDEAFSLYAVAKAIQRLRDRLEKSGVSGSFIQTKRGEGYLLVN